MSNFTPIAAILGGTLIGMAAVLMMALSGRITGISGILAGSLFSRTDDTLWRWMFLAGLVGAPLLIRFVGGAPTPFVVTDSWPVIVIGGVLVGFGTRLGSGCTSGHGVCGLSRLSHRSLAAVIVFMAAGVVTATLARPAIGG